MKNIAVIFPKDSEAIFNHKSTATFGGATVQMFLIAKELNKYSEYKVFSFVPNFKITYDHLSSEFNFVKVINVKDFVVIKAIKIIFHILRNKINIVIQHGLTPSSGLLAFVCKMLNVKYVFMFAHDVEVRGKFQKNSSKTVAFFKLLLNNSAQLITQNMYQHAYLLKHYHVGSVILYQGFDTLEAIPIKEEYILWVARADKWKQPELFLKLAKSCPNLKFKMICPKLNDEQYYAQIKKTALKISNLEFLDFVPFNEINDYFKKAKILVNTSISEGYPQTFIQALIYGTPIVSLNVDPDKNITKYSLGFVCNDFINMKNKINSFYKDNEMYKAISEHAFQFAKSKHDLGINTHKLLNIFCE